MRGSILFLIVAIFCGLVTVCDGTPCTKITARTCKKSLLMTGQCVDGVCQCVSPDYTPGPFGCQKKPKSEITADFQETIQTGASSALYCTKTISTCTWFKDGVQLQEQGDELDLNFVTPEMNGAYTCISDPAGISSHQSDPFHVKVVDTFTTKLEVSGMPAIVVPGTTIELTCVVREKYAIYTFQWILDGRPVPGEDLNTYSHTVTTRDAGKSIKCSLPNAVESDQVVFPTNFATDIDGVEINPMGPTTMLVGTALDLHCKLTGGFPQPSYKDELIRYVWKKDDAILEYETYQSIHIYADHETAGPYTCEASLGSNPPKVSQPLTISVKITMAEKDLISSSYGHIKYGYFSFLCDYDTVDTSIPVTYSWFQGWTELKGVTDNMIQVEGVTDNYIYDGLYSCVVTSQDGSSVKSWLEGVWLQPLSEIANDRLDFISPPTIGVGTPVTFECDPYLFHTPGMEYTWTIGATRQKGQISNSLVYTPQSGDRVRVKCEYTFDGITSQQTNSIIKPEYIYSVTVRSNALNVTALQLVAGTTVKLLCDVSKSEGVGPVTYQWKKLSKILPGETLPYYLAKMGPSGAAPLMISCLATVDSVTVASRELTVAPQTYAATPILLVESDDSFKREGEVVMSCLSKSDAEGAIFEWTKDNTVIKGQTSYKYKIDEVTQTDDGSYSCRIIIGGRTSNASTVAKLKTLPNVKDCMWASECSDANMDSSVCYHGNCKCLSGFTMKGGKCLSSSKLHGRDPQSAPPSRGSLIFRQEVVNRLNVGSNPVEMEVEDMANPWK